MNTAIIQFHNGQAVGDVSKRYLQSYVGMVDISVINDSLEKVQALYGADTQWEQVVDRAIVGAGGKWNAKQEFGEDAHTLTVDEIPPTEAVFAIRPTETGNSAFSTATWGGKNVSIDTIPSDSTGCWARSNTMKEAQRIKISNGGGGLAHNNIQQSYGMYIWVRVS